MTPQRRRLLLELLRRLGLDPAGPAGPGSSDSALAPIEEALSHRSAGRPVDHEQLEFLGDAVLRLAASLYLRRHHPQLSVGQSSALRAQLVSDRWLGELALACGLEPLLHLGATAAADRAGRTTVLAECCEALIGGLFIAWGGSDGGLEPVLQWLTPHWQKTSAELLQDPHRHNWKSALQEWSQGPIAAKSAAGAMAIPAVFTAAWSSAVRPWGKAGAAPVARPNSRRPAPPWQA